MCIAQLLRLQVLPIIRTPMWKWRQRDAVASVGLGLIVLALAGCGNTERALTLPEVRASMNAAGLTHLHVLTYNSTAAGILEKADPSLTIDPKAQPDYLQDRQQPGLLLMRIPKVSVARRAVPKSRTEHGDGWTARTDRVCNVLVVNYGATDSTYSALASHTERELRRRCR